MYNLPNAYINALIELDMQVIKEKRIYRIYKKFIMQVYKSHVEYKCVLLGYKEDKICQCFHKDSMRATFF